MMQECQQTKEIDLVIDNQAKDTLFRQYKYYFKVEEMDLYQCQIHPVIIK